MSCIYGLVCHNDTHRSIGSDGSSASLTDFAAAFQPAFEVL